MAWRSVKFLGRFTAFRHLGFFPEQAANWVWLDEQLRPRPGLKLLNLFGSATWGWPAWFRARCGAVGHPCRCSTRLEKGDRLGAGENAELSGMADRPIRWICEDARRYVQREVRRGVQYDGIILDPPWKYGRGPNGEVWRLFEDLPELLNLCVGLLAPDASFLILNAYAERVSGSSLATLLGEAMAGRGGRIDWGELALMEAAGDRGVGLFLLCALEHAP